MPTPRMLIADDNPLSLRFLSEALARLGIEHVAAVDGAQALAAALDESFDLLLLDARMPGFGGAEVLARVRAQAGPSQHVIALASTADNVVAVQVALREAGFADVLLKPLSIDALRSALARHLPLPRPPADERVARASTHPTPAEPASTTTLDDHLALAAAGGDAAIVAALRGLFAAELDGLPVELAAIAARRDAEALRERLHRLDASAGFCGAPAMQRATRTLRSALDAPAWPHAAAADFLDVCAHTRAMLA